MLKVGFLFPGYGSQYIGMGKNLYDNFRIVQDFFEDASSCLDINFVKLCFASSDSEISKLHNAYFSIFLISYSTASLIKSELDIDISLVSGFQFGEYCAMSYAGALNFPDSLYLIKKFIEFYYDSKISDTLSSIVIDGLSYENLLNIKEIKHILNYVYPVFNYYNQVIISGNNNFIDELYSFFKASYKVKYIKDEIGLHTPLADVISNNLKLYLTKVDFKSVNLPFISSINGNFINSTNDVENFFLNFWNKSLNWDLIISSFQDMDLILVPAPSKILSSKLKNVFPNKAIFAIESLEDIENLKYFINSINNSIFNKDHSFII